MLADCAGKRSLYRQVKSTTSTVVASGIDTKYIADDYKSLVVQRAFEASFAQYATGEFYRP